jgi:NAD(P)-dependent dehydrogenase (short-subunit alcohol dehydrogenase family)
MDLQNRAALITGGRRIGAAIAADLARRGMDVTLSYNRSSSEATATGDVVRAAGRRAFAIAADLSNARDCARLVDEAAAAMGRLDVLINMASVYAAVPFDAMDEASWDAVVNVDLKAAFLCARAAVPHLRRVAGGRIINFSDWIAVSGRPRYKSYLAYYVAKHAVVGLSEALALELAGDQILVNTVAPGPILPPPGTSPEEISSVASSTPVGRWGGEVEITKAVAFLLETDFATGETLRVDGGRHVR